MNYLKIVLYILMFLALFCTVYLFISKSIELKLQEKIKDKINENGRKLIDKYDESVKQIKRTQYYKAKKERKHLRKVELLLIKSNVQKHCKYLTVEVFIVLSVFLGLIAYCITYFFMVNILASLTIGITTYYIPQFILNIIISINNSKIDVQLLYYCSTLENFSSSNDNIIEAMKKTDDFLVEPLKSFNQTFINEVTHGISTYRAFENYREKVESKRLKNFLKNLQLCSKHNGSYLEVLRINHDILLNYSVEQDRRKKAVSNGRVSIIFIMILGIVITRSLLSINPALYVMLQNSFVGQLIVTYMLLVYLFSIYKCITLEKFNL